MINISNQRFGRLIAIEVHHHNNGVYWLCQCDCGGTTVVHGNNLRHHRTLSCGCLQKEKASGIKSTKTNIGDIYTRLTVIKRRPDLETTKQALFECSCTCGNITVVRGSHLRNGLIRSCGCYSIEKIIERSRTHGMSKDSQYQAFLSGRNREFNSQWTLEMQYALKEFQTECVVCGSQNYLEVDHVMPLSSGYGLYPGNAVILCRSHNRKKHKKTLDNLPVHMRDSIVQAAEEFYLWWEENGDTYEIRPF